MLQTVTDLTVGVLMGNICPVAVEPRAAQKLTQQQQYCFVVILFFVLQIENDHQKTWAGVSEIVLTTIKRHSKFSLGRRHTAM